MTEIKNLWIDIGVSSEEEARALIEIGDPVTLELGYRALQGNLAAAPGMDDRVGVWTIMMAAKQVAAANPTAGPFMRSRQFKKRSVYGVQKLLRIRSTPISALQSMSPMQPIRLMLISTNMVMSKLIKDQLYFEVRT